MPLDNSRSQNQQGLPLSAQATYCFTIPLSLGSRRIQAIALLDSGVSACFLDEEFAKLQKIPLVRKAKLVHVEVIDERPLSSGSVTHETIPLEVTFQNHSSQIIFNIIKTPSNPVILGLSWLERYNPSIDWKSRTMTFPIKTPQKKPVKRPQIDKPLFVGARAFMK